VPLPNPTNNSTEILSERLNTADRQLGSVRSGVEAADLGPPSAEAPPIPPAIGDLRQRQIQAARQSEDWSVLVRYLQQWLRGGEPPLDWHQRSATDQAALLDLAMQVLYWGDFHARWEIAKLMPLFGQAAIAPLLAMLQSEGQDNATRYDLSDGQYDGSVASVNTSANTGLNADINIGLNTDLNTGFNDGLSHSSNGGPNSGPHASLNASPNASPSAGPRAPIDPDAQWFAVRILGELQPLPTTLIAVLAATANPDLQAMAVSVLAQMGDAVIAPIGPLLLQPATRLLATQILAQIPHPQVIPHLMAVTADGDALVRAAAIEALGRFHHEVIPPVLLQALKDPAPLVRQAAVSGLGFNPQPGDWVPHIQPLLLDLNLAVGRQAALTLGRFGTDAAVDALDQALNAPALPDALGVDLVRSLAWSETDRGIERLAQAITTLPLSAPLQREICAVLGRVETPALRSQAVAVLRLVLATGVSDDQLPIADDPARTDHRALQTTIVRALGQLGQPEAIPDLIQLLASPDPGLRLHIAAALKALKVDVAVLRAQAESPQSPLMAGIAAILPEW
jgi:HEAT repeat protein